LRLDCNGYKFLSHRGGPANTPYFFVQPGELALIGIVDALENANAEKVRRESRDRLTPFLCNA
jgi:hypothetical protein